MINCTKYNPRVMFKVPMHPEMESLLISNLVIDQREGTVSYTIKMDLEIAKNVIKVVGIPGYDFTEKSLAKYMEDGI